MLYVHPGYMSLDRARAIIYYAEIDTLCSEREERIFEDFRQDEDGTYKIFTTDIASTRLVLPVQLICDMESNGWVPVKIAHPSIEVGLIEWDLEKGPRHNADRGIQDFVYASFPALYSTIEKELLVPNNLRLIISRQQILVNIRKKLASGHIQAALQEANGAVISIPPHYWNSDAAWEVLQHDTTAYVEIERNIKSGKVVINTNSIVKYYDFSDIDGEGEELGVSVEDEGCDVKNKTGAKPKYDKDLFMWEALKYIYYVSGCVPSDHSEHAIKTIERYKKAGGYGEFEKDTNGKYKASRWARAEISNLWKKMDFTPGHKLPDA
ncbi:hypothetical protein PUR29_36340 [Methylobacterium ajmalii]|uniref:Uncharacterized protein n=1 Tax=Methylobacterium ajmalii TaxID=2738439 RepID=A0ABV0A507_9HYPH